MPFSETFLIRDENNPQFSEFTTYHSLFLDILVPVRLDNKLNYWKMVYAQLVLIANTKTWIPWLAGCEQPTSQMQGFHLGIIHINELGQLGQYKERNRSNTLQVSLIFRQCVPSITSTARSVRQRESVEISGKIWLVYRHESASDPPVFCSFSEQAPTNNRLAFCSGKIKKRGIGASCN